MTTTPLPTITYIARVEALLAGILAAVAILALLIWAIAGVTNASTDHRHATPVPSPQAPPEPPWPTQQPPTTRR